MAVDADDGHVERAAAQIEDQGRRRGRSGDGRQLEPDRVASLFEVLTKGAGQGGGGRFVNDIHHLQPGDPPGVLGGLAAVVSEVSGNGDDRLAHRAYLLPGVQDQPLEHQGRQGFGRELLAADRLAVEPLAHVALEVEGRPVGMFAGRQNRLTPDQDAPVGENLDD